MRQFPAIMSFLMRYIELAWSLGTVPRARDVIGSNELVVAVSELLGILAKLDTGASGRCDLPWDSDARLLARLNQGSTSCCQVSSRSTGWSN